MESSRGCWWGEKNRCLFCGLNHPKKSYRSKSPGRMLAEVEELENRYGISRFEFADNILDMGYFDSVIPYLKGSNGDRTFFYETKASLTREHMRRLKDAGCIWLQPGIESLDTRVLKLIHKGVTAAQNIRLLRWAREFGIRLSWHILWGFPGECDDWYTSVAKMMPVLEHLQPPDALLKVQIHRNSHYFENVEKYHLSLKSPPAMKYAYDLPENDLMDLSYAFLPEGWRDSFNGSAREIFEGRP